MRSIAIAALLLPAICLAQDPGRPVLKRGGPAEDRKPVERPEGRIEKIPEPAPSAPGEKPPVAVVEVDAEGNATKVQSGSTLSQDEELIQRARVAAYEFSQNLPNFICTEHVLRYKGEGLRPKWKLEDRVEVDLVFFDQKEDYQNLRINGKKLKKGSPEDSGTWSTGEFGTTLLDLMAGNTNAKFKARPGTSNAAGLTARVFDFTVPKDGAHWEIRIGRPVRPPYQGAIWVDPESARILRIEMDTRQLPPDYAVSKVEMVVDYGWVDIAGTKYLLPSRSENLSCYRDSVTCTKNETEFRNYRKFSTESQVLQTDSEISFPTDDDAKSGKKPDYIPPSLDPEAKPVGKKQESKKKQQ